MYVNIVYSVLLTCADPWAGRAGCSSSDTGLSMLAAKGKFDATSASFSAEHSSELVLLVEQPLFLGTQYDTALTVFVATSENTACVLAVTSLGTLWIY